MTDDLEDDDWAFEDRLTCDTLRNPSAKRSVVALRGSLRRSKLREAVKVRLGKELAKLELAAPLEEALVSALADEYAHWFFKGACAEAEKIDDALEVLNPYPHAGRDGLKWYGQSVVSVCANAIGLLRESVRDDPAHKGRMGQRTSEMQSAIQCAADAWERRAEN